MRYLAASALLPVFVIIALTASPLTARDEQKAQPPRREQKGQASSLTGCVDEQDGKYVLLDDRMLNKLANLETAIAGSEDVFAKHMGHKVIVKGTRVSGQETVFKVASIEQVAAVCSAAQGTNQ